MGRDREALDDAEEAVRLGPAAADDWFNLACTFSLVAGRGGSGPDRSAGYRRRALVLLGKALDSIPPERRPAYWRDKVLRDADLLAVRDTPEFARIGAALADHRPEPDPPDSPR